MEHMDQEKKDAINHLMHHSNHRFGIVYDFITICSAFLTIPQKYDAGIEITVVEMNVLYAIYAEPGVTATQLCKKWNRTRSAISQILKKLREKDMIYQTKLEGHEKVMQLYLTADGIGFITQVIANEHNDTTHLFSSLLDYGCTGPELETFYKVMDVYTSVMRDSPELGWNNLIVERGR
jgi:DNA-binding MarR family transcriptional regulator